MKLAVVIPTLDAESYLADSLERLKAADEIVIADGGSSDATIAIAEGAGARFVTTASGRGVQLAAGAKAARGDWLLFLHADTLLAPGWRAAADAHGDKSSGSAACFRLRLDDAAWQARAIERAVAWRTRLLGLPYGDQGLLISRALYDSVGGYRPLALMEDVDLVRRLGRRLVMLDHDATTSAERWRRDGWAARSARNLVCVSLYSLGVPPARIARLYA
ncbi:MAG: TIGR04283 family arsenosugar biosynthesis glycosyltransferase [Sphingosinicella sp.]